MQTIVTSWEKLFAKLIKNYYVTSGRDIRNFVLRMSSASRGMFWKNLTRWFCTLRWKSSAKRGALHVQDGHSVLITHMNMLITTFHQSTRNGCPTDSVGKKVPKLLPQESWANPRAVRIPRLWVIPPDGRFRPQEAFRTIFHWEKPQAPKKKPSQTSLALVGSTQTSQGLLLISTKPRAQSKYRPLSFNRTPPETMCHVTQIQMEI